MLKKKKQIDLLFSSGKKLHSGALSLIFAIDTTEVDGFKVAFAVPKRSFKKAVDRNRIKRLLREVFRLNQDQIPENRKGLLFLVLFKGRESPSFAYLDKKIKDLIQRLNEDFENEKD